MSKLREAVEEYLALRQRLGAQLRGVASGLQTFAAFAEQEGSAHVTIDTALRWATQSTGNKLATVVWRLHMVRGFARWRQATDPRTEVPPPDLLPFRYPRKPPYLYSDEEVDGLILAAQHLPSPTGLRGLTYATLFGLLAVTGMRVSETVGLDREDVNLDDGVLVIRRTKFRKSRLVPLHASSCEILSDYVAKRDRLFPRPTTAAFFVSEKGRRVTQWAARYTFVKVSSQIGLRPALRGHRYGRGPRLHDLRHRFAAQTLIDWYRAGIDVERELPRLATYLGHVHVNETYWYLQAVPELLELATQRVLDGRKETKR